MSDTPRTDAAEFPVMTTFSKEHPLVVRSTLARKMERDLNAAKAEAELNNAVSSETNKKSVAVIQKLKADIADLKAELVKVTAERDALAQQVKDQEEEIHELLRTWGNA